MAATVFEPVNAQIRPAECTSIRQQKAKLKLREDMREERTAVESDREDDYERVPDNVPAPQRRPSQRPVVSKPFQAGSATYKIVYSASNGKQIPRFVPDAQSCSKDKKPTEANAKKDAAQNKGCR
ncbi:hypothetical protein AAVH_00212 [Aphelenchoides avenae]|nr:hypothetical protein AAVH_00212 [Aphelenchus avenae]